MSDDLTPFDDLNFDNLVIEERPVTFNKKNYTLREADGEASVVFRNKTLSCMKFGADGKANEVRNLADLEPLLVSLCLFDENNRRVNENVIRKWPSRVVKALFETAKEISSLSEVDIHRKRLFEALSDESSSITKEEFQSWASSLDETKHADLKKWISSEGNNKIKN